LIRTVAKNQFAVSAIIVCVRILFMFTYAKIEYVSVRAYLSVNRIHMLRILEPWVNELNYIVHTHGQMHKRTSLL